MGMILAEPSLRSASAIVPPVTEKSFDEHHLYTLSRPTTLRDRQTKQVEFIGENRIPHTPKDELIRVSPQRHRVRDLFRDGDGKMADLREPRGSAGDSPPAPICRTRALAVVRGTYRPAYSGNRVLFQAGDGMGKFFDGDSWHAWGVREIRRSPYGKPLAASLFFEAETPAVEIDGQRWIWKDGSWSTLGEPVPAEESGPPKSPALKVSDDLVSDNKCGLFADYAEVSARTGYRILLIIRLFGGLQRPQAQVMGKLRRPELHERVADQAFAEFGSNGGGFRFFGAGLDEGNFLIAKFTGNDARDQ